MARKKKTTASKNPGGRPSKYQKDFAEQAAKLCVLGAIDREIADFFEVTEQTLNNWKLAHPEFFEALKTAKTEANNRVVESLYHRALGYEHDEVHISNYLGTVTLTPIVKHYPPDTTAAIFWLKNRESDEWRDIKAIEHSGSIGQHHLTEMTEEELVADIAAAQAELGKIREPVGRTAKEKAEPNKPPVVH